MSKTMANICARAQAAAMEPDHWLRQQERERDEAAFGEYWADAELCHACGWQGIPEYISSGGISVKVCPGCGRDETFGEPEVQE